MSTPDEPRPENLPPNYNPNELANNMQNLQMSPPNQQQPSNPIVSPPRPIGRPPFVGSRPSTPPSGVFPRSPVPVNDPSPCGFPPGLVSTGPNGTPPASQTRPHFAYRPPPPGVLSGPGPRIGPLPSSLLSSGQPIQAQMRASGPVSHGLSVPPVEMIQNGSRFATVTGGMTGPSQVPTVYSPGPLSQPPRPSFGPPPFGVPPIRPPFSASPQNMPPPMPFSAPVRSMLHSSGPPYGYTWPPQPQQMPPLLPPDDPTLQQPIFGMPPPPPLRNQPVALNQIGQSRMDTDQIPCIEPSSAVILHETRQANQANPPPPATSDYIVMDTGNCSPRYMRCTLNQIPCTGDLLSASAMQLALLVQPLALPHPSEEPIQVVDFGESGPVRCSRCKGYVNQFMKFIDHGKRFICNFCGFADETPQDYFCNLGPDGRRRDADERPELCRGTVEFVASREFMLRDPVQPVLFFIIDVSLNAIQTGATAAACNAVNQVLADLPEGPRTMVGVATFDSTIHFYNLKCAQEQPSMLVVPDIQDVYTPLQSDVIVQLTECRQQLEILLENIPTIFQKNRVADSAFGAAVKHWRKTSCLPFGFALIGIGSLSTREGVGKSNVPVGEKEAQKLLQPSDKILNTMATEFAKHQVCVDLFITTQSYVDIASLSDVPRTTGGQMYYYYPFSALCDSAKLYNDLRWNVTRPQGYEAVMRVRCSQGIDVMDYSGNFYKSLPAEVDLPAIDCDKTIMVSVKHDDKLQEGSECSFQCALIYTNVYGQRRIRVSTLSLPCTSMLSSLFCSADLETQFACILKQVARDFHSVPLSQVRDKTTSICTSILSAYRKSSATVSSGQFILPAALKLLPLYTLALTKNSGLRPNARIDERSYWINHVSALSTPLLIPLVYPRLIAVHDLDEKDLDDSVIPSPVSLSSAHVTDEGVYLLENGEDCLIYVGGSVQPNILRQMFSVSSVQEMSDKFILEQYDNALSKKLNAIVNEIRRQRCSYLRLKLCRKGDPSGELFFSYMVEDKTQNELSYVEYLMHIHRHIQSIHSK